MGDTRVEHATEAARRRRERRLRAYLKYARMSVAMALAEANHHTAPRGQKPARAEATNDTSKERVAGDAVYFELFEGCFQGQSWTLGLICGFCSTPWSMRTPSAFPVLHAF